MLAREGGRPLYILRAVSSGLAMVFSKLGLMSFLEVCVFTMLFSGATI